MKKDLFKICGLAVLFCLFAFVGSLSAQTAVNKTEVFKVQDGNGDYTWTVPTELDGIPITVTNIRFEAIGGGGAGGYVYDHKGGEAASGGGGGGAYTYLEVANPQETSYTIHVGKGGTSIASTRTNTSGFASTVSGSNGIILQAAGGMTVVPTNHGTVSTNYYTKAGAEGGKIADCIPQANATAGGNGSDGDYGLLWTVSGDGGYAAGPADLAGDGGHTSNQSYILSDGKSGNIGFNYGGGGSGAQAYSVRLGNNIERNGGAGADGVVRVTYAYEIDGSVAIEPVEANVCSGVDFRIPLDVEITGSLDPTEDVTILAFIDAPVGIFASNYGVTYDEANSQFVLTGKITNATGSVANIEVLGSVVETGTENITIANLTVYTPLAVGTISSNANCNGTTLIMAEATGGSSNYSYQWLDGDNAVISDANGLTYTPTETGDFYGVAIDNVCELADTTDGVTVDEAISFDPGTIGRNDTIVCPNNTYTTTLYANTTASGTIQWQRKYNDNEWRNVISHGPSHGAGSYNVLIHASQFDTVNTASYRYLIKPEGCDEFVPCNDVFIVSKKEFPSYEEQFEAVTITLPYGECTFNIDSLKAPELPETEVDTVYVAEDQEKNLAPSETPYKVVWNVVDVVCGVITTDTQLVTVQFPVCGEGLIAEDAENNSYTTVRIGCDCWMAENLRTSAANAVYYDEDAENADFGMLYSLADVFPPVRATSPENAPIQGICPEGWAVPTLAQYNALMAVAGSVENLKATTGWLPEYVGTNETGFTAIAPGFYNASADQFQKHLTFAGFWTSSSSDVAGTGVIFEINYNCDNGTPSGAPEANKYSVRCVKVNEE
jgi:uncharacterized protein (TIGR02145 family)